LQTARHALQRRNDPRCSEMVSGHGDGRGALHTCVDASGTAEGWKRGRGPSAFLGRYLSRHPRPPPGADALTQAHRSRPPRTPDARSGEAWAGEKARAFPQGFARGTVRRIAHRAKPEWWLRGAAAGKVFRKKRGWPRAGFRASTVPDAPTHARRDPRLPPCPDTARDPHALISNFYIRCALALRSVISKEAPRSTVLRSRLWRRLRNLLADARSRSSSRGPADCSYPLHKQLRKSVSHRPRRLPRNDTVYPHTVSPDLLRVGFHSSVLDRSGIPRTSGHL
jgi:hypothetical protein